MAAGRVPNGVWAVLLAAHGLALGWALTHGTWHFPDSDRYRQAAENLRQQGQLYARPWPASAPRGQAVQEFTIRPVGYPLLVRALGGTAPQPVWLLTLQNLLSLLSLGLVLRWWARRARPQDGEWGLATVMTLSFPAQLIYANAVMSEIPLQATVVAIMGMSLLFIGTEKKRYLLGMAGGATVALLLKPAFYPLALVIALLGLAWGWRRRRASIVGIGLLPLVAVALCMGWNEQRTGYFHFSSIAEINLLHYNAAGVVRQVGGPAAAAQWVTDVLDSANAQPDFAARQQLIRRRAGAVIREHPLVYARQHLLGMAALVLDPGRFDIGQFLGIAPPAGGGLLVQVRAEGLWRVLKKLPLGLLAGLAAVLLANVARLALALRGFRRLGRAGRVWRTGRWVALGLLFYVALLTGPLGAARFLVPVWPLLLGLALAGVGRGTGPRASGAKQLPPLRERPGQG